MAIKVDEVLFEGSSEYQRVGVYKTSTYGHMMTLDGVIQSTQRDEYAYVRPLLPTAAHPGVPLLNTPYLLTRRQTLQHEMMAHIPMHLHKNPETVCIIGGGDGGVMREVMQHPSVKACDLCDIDGVVVEQSKIHLKHRETPASALCHYFLRRLVLVSGVMCVVLKWALVLCPVPQCHVDSTTLGHM